MCLSNALYSQCILTKISFNDCETCRGSLQALTSNKTGLPIFVVFPKYRMDDSTDIQRVGSFRNMNIQTIYSDTWYNKLQNKGCQSSVFGLDKYGVIRYQSCLTELDILGIKDFINQNKIHDYEDVYNMTVIRDSLLYFFDVGIGKLKISNYYNNESIKIIKSGEVSMSQISKNMSADEANRFLLYAEELNKEPSFKSKFNAFQMGSDKSVYLRLQYYTMEDTSLGFVAEKNCIVKYDSIGNFKDVILIQMDTNFVIYDGAYLQDNDSFIYCNIRPKEGIHKLMSSRSPKYFIARFSKKNGTYYLDGYIKYQMPFINRKKYFDSYLSSNISSYPYVANSYANEIFHLNNRVLINIIDTSSYKYNILESIDADKEPFRVFPIKFDHYTNSLLVPYKNGNYFYLNVYDTNLTLLYSKELGLSLYNDRLAWSMEIYPSVDLAQIYFKYGEDSFSFISLPITLINN